MKTAVNTPWSRLRRQSVYLRWNSGLKGWFSCFKLLVCTYRGTSSFMTSALDALVFVKVCVCVCVCVHLRVGFIFLCFRGECSLPKQQKQTNPRNLRNQRNMFHGFRQGACRRSSSPKPGQTQSCTIEHRPLLWICLIDFLPFAHPYMHVKSYTPVFVSIIHKNAFIDTSKANVPWFLQCFFSRHVFFWEQIFTSVLSSGTWLKEELDHATLQWDPRTHPFGTPWRVQVHLLLSWQFWIYWLLVSSLAEGTQNEPKYLSCYDSVCVSWRVS